MKQRRILGLLQRTQVLEFLPLACASRTEIRPLPEKEAALLVLAKVKVQAPSVPSKIPVEGRRDGRGWKAHEYFSGVPLLPASCKRIDISSAGAPAPGGPRDHSLMCAY